MKTHEVQQGECLVNIAHRYGFSDWRAIYDLPANEALRKQRPNPEVLHPGDQVIIPDLEPKQLACATGAKHVFQLRRPSARIRLVFVDHVDGHPLEADYELDFVDLELMTGSLDAGLLDVIVPSGATHATLRLLRAGGQVVLRVVELRLGHLDPADTVSGLQSRLRRLGFDCGPSDADMGPRTRMALQAFQRARELGRSGEADADSVSELSRIIGR